MPSLENVKLKLNYSTSTLCYIQLLFMSAIVLKSIFLGCVFVLSRCFLDFSVGVGAFVIGLSQMYSFFFF